MREIDWIMSEDTGVSSKTIMAVMIGASINWRSDIPHDPSDFGRCYRLLKIFPEYEERLHEVTALFPEWQPLVNNWNQLTALYEEELKREDGRVPKLHKMMRKLTSI